MFHIIMYLYYESLLLIYCGNRIILAYISHESILRTFVQKVKASQLGRIFSYGTRGMQLEKRLSSSLKNI